MKLFLRTMLFLSVGTSLGAYASSETVVEDFYQEAAKLRRHRSLQLQKQAAFEQTQGKKKLSARGGLRLFLRVLMPNNLELRELEWSIDQKTWTRYPVSNWNLKWMSLPLGDRPEGLQFVYFKFKVFERQEMAPFVPDLKEHLVAANVPIYSKKGLRQHAVFARFFEDIAAVPELTELDLTNPEEKL